MPELKPRKLPRQKRAQSTFDAIVEACARLLRRGDYAALTTNHIAVRAGVGIGTLYEYFPNKQAIVAALAERQFERLLREVGEAVEVALGLAEREAAEFLIRRIIDAVSSDRQIYAVLLRQTPFVWRLEATKRAVAAFLELGRSAGERSRERLNLPNLEADTWLISRMISNAVLEIAFLEDPSLDRKLLTDELVRLTFRLIQGRDPAG